MIGIDVGTDLVFLCSSFDGSNDSMLGSLLLVNAIGSTDGKVFCFNEAIKLVFSDDKVLVTIIG